MRFYRRPGTVAGALIAAAVLTGCATAVSGSAQTASGASSVSVSSPTSSMGQASVPTSTAESSEPLPGSTIPTDTSDSVPVESSSSAPVESSSSASVDPSKAATEARLYPTEPYKYNKNPSTEDSGKTVEGRRLSAFVVSPSQIRANVTESQGLSTLPLRGGEALTALLSDPVPTVAERGGMYTGFVATRSDPQTDETLQIAVFVYPDAAAAKKAATDLTAASKDEDSKPVTVPGRAAATGWVRSQSSSGSVSTFAFEASGQQVMYVWASDIAANVDFLPQTIGKALAAQAELLKGYKATPRDQLTKLEIDPDGLLARTLIKPEGEATVWDGYWPVKGSLHRMLSYTDTAALFTETGVDSVAMSRSSVYRAKDAGSATKIVDEFIGEVLAANTDMQPMDSPVDGAQLKCANDPIGAQFYCVGQVDRVAFEYWSESQQDMEKSMAAQLELLTA